MRDRGRYFHLYGTQNAFLSAYTGAEYDEPWVGYTVQTSGMSYNKTEEDILKETPLTFEIEGDGDIRFKASSSAALRTLEYRKNAGEWTEITSATGDTAPTISVVSGDVVEFRGENATFSTSYGSYNTFSGTTCQFRVKGNVTSVFRKEGFAMMDNYPSNYSFDGLFQRCTGLTDASELILPAVDIRMGSYEVMFQCCTSLVGIPKLPGVTLQANSYKNMFSGCSSIEEFIDFHVTACTGDSVCEGMFKACTSLKVIPKKFPAMSVPYNGYNGMFSNCNSLEYVDLELPATGLSNNCYWGMFASCANLKRAVKVLPAQTVGECAYRAMFMNSTALTDGPTIMATTLRNGACFSMFYGCKNLTGISMDLNFTTLLGADACREMFLGCWSLKTTPTVLPATALTNACYEDMFNGCSGITAAPLLPASSLTNGCYCKMFYNCKSLTNFQDTLPATTLPDWCYDKMFYGCTSLTTTAAFTAATIGTRSLLSMYDNCKNITTQRVTFTASSVGSEGCRYMFQNTAISVAPELPMTSIGNYGYGNMFNGCGSLLLAPRLPATTLGNNAYGYMFQNCRIMSLPANYVLPAATVPNGAYNRLFVGCWSITTGPDFSAMKSVGNSGCYAMFYDCSGLTGVADFNPTGTAGNSAFHEMFYGCKNLVSASTSLSFDSGGTYCCYNMFYNCTALTLAPALPATGISANCYRQMFYNCNHLTTAPAILPATTLAGWCYANMFGSCTALTGAGPTIPAATLPDNSCNDMFYGTKINALTCLATDISASNCTFAWLRGVPTTGTFTKAASATWPTTDSGTNGWTVVDAV